MLCRETNTRTWSSCDFVSVGAQSIVKRRCHTKETRTGTREQEEMRKSMWGTGRQEKSEKCQGHHRLEIDKCCHGSGRIAVGKVDRKAREGCTIKDVIVRMSKPVHKGNNFVQCRSYRKGSADIGGHGIDNFLPSEIGQSALLHLDLCMSTGHKQYLLSLLQYSHTLFFRHLTFSSSSFELSIWHVAFGHDKVNISQLE